MKDKCCPYCKGRAEIKPLLDPYKKSGVKDRFMMFEYACNTKGCYLHEGAGNYVDKDNLKVLTDQWANIPDYVKVIKKPKIVKVVKKPVLKKGKTYTVHFSVSGKKDKVQCSSRKNAREWSNDVHKVSCPRCLRTEAVQFLLNRRNVS